MGLFVKTDAASIKDYLMGIAEKGCNTTLYDGDERRVFIESVITPIAVGLYNVIDDTAKQKMRQYARGEVLDAIGGSQVVRLQAQKATTTLRFKLDEIKGENILIPAGTRVSTTDDHYFSTDSDATIEAGALTVDVSATAENGGSEYNGFQPGLIAVIIDAVNCDSCENTVESSGGDDGEPYDTEGDDRYRERIALYQDSLSVCGTANGYRYYALSADASVVDANVISTEEEEIQSDYDVIIYIICKVGDTITVPDAETLQHVQDECSRKDVRPMTDRVLVSAATQVSYSIELTYYVAESDAEEAETIVEAAVNDYVMQQDSSIGQAINPDALVGKIMKAQDSNGNYLDISRCIVTNPSYTELTFNQVGHCSGISITQRVVH